MKTKRLLMLCICVCAVFLLSATAFAIDESEVESAIAASSREEVAGNVFIWFLCAVAFLKISQKIDSFMTSLGINVGRTGGSMLAELMIAGRAIGSAVRATGGGIGSVFNRSSSSSSTTNRAAGQGFTGGGSGLIGVAQRAAGNAAVANATGRSSGIGSAIGGAMFASSMKNNGRFATDVVSTVATGSISSVGTISGPQASEALTNYLGYGSVSSGTSGPSPSSSGAGVVSGSARGAASGVSNDAGSVSRPASEPAGAEAIPVSPYSSGGISASTDIGEDTITENGGAAAGAKYFSGSSSPEAGGSIPCKPPTFRDVEIGGGRITGYETPADGGAERQFAMYNAAQYMEPTGSYEKIETVDGQSWYKQYAEPTVQKTPYEDESGKIKYDEKIVDQLPQIPKRKDRV